MSERTELKDWIGNQRSVTDVVTPWPLAALDATLDRREPEPRAGDAVPLGWHWLYFLEASPASEIGSDGHPRRGDFLPPVRLPRRMWAGGRIEFARPLKVGETARLDSEIVSVESKQGRTGNLVFVTVRHTITASGSAAVIEEHDIVYRDAPRPGDPPPPLKPAPADAAWRREVIADQIMLFRFSALIFNAHRIHYDIEYCRNEEGYPGLIVHGPLQTVLLLDLCRRNDSRPVRQLEYRALHPLFHFERFTVNGAPTADSSKVALWVANPAGGCTMSATAYF
ncbi:MAG: MaoC family dehydratase N-terminal domain-containing protein [Betaproteobacteria bacterium]|nr:MaoC family dehydratase N-terminal domain-containing protein [Betaproteobacteria bacterium]MDH3437883.1 MaoC family dehydratase N-terminal domain-containing protein [Betaproteobacteria bacterium]